MDESPERRPADVRFPDAAAQGAPADAAPTKGSVSFVVLSAVLANVALTVAKYVAADLSGSSALLSEAFHSTADTANSLLLIVGVKLSQKPADHLHPFGRGKEIYFWGLMVAIMLFGLGGGLSLYEGVQHVIRPHPLEDAFWSYVVLACALVCEGTSFAIATANMRRIARARGESFFSAAHSSKNPEHFVVLFEDSAALIGIFVAFAGVYGSHHLRAPVLDGVASIVIGGVLAMASLLLAYECRSLLLGEGADPAKVADIRAIVSADPAVVRVGETLTMHLGPQDVLLNLTVDFRDELSAAQVENAVQRLESKIRARHPDVRRIFIEVTALVRPDASRQTEASRQGSDATGALSDANAQTSSDSPLKLGVRTQRS